MKVQPHCQMWCYVCINTRYVLLRGWQWETSSFMESTWESIWNGGSMVLWRLHKMCSPKTKDFDYKPPGNLELAWSNAQRIESACRRFCLPQIYSPRIFKRLLLNLFSLTFNTLQLTCSELPKWLFKHKQAYHLSVGTSMLRVPLKHWCKQAPGTKKLSSWALKVNHSPLWQSAWCFLHWWWNRKLVPPSVLPL